MYINKILTQDEQVLVEAKLHWIKYVIPWFLIIVGLSLTAFVSGFLMDLFTVASLIGLFPLGIGLYLWIKNKTTHMVVTNHRIILKTGIIAVRVHELRNAKVESINLHQTFFGRVFGWGNIAFTGTGEFLFCFEYVAKPAFTASRIKEIIDNR